MKSSKLNRVKKDGIKAGIIKTEKQLRGKKRSLRSRNECIQMTESEELTENWGGRELAHTQRRQAAGSIWL